MFACEVSYPFKDGSGGCFQHFCDGVHGKSMAIEKDGECFLCEGSTSVYVVFCPLVMAVFALIALFFLDASIFDEV